VFGVGDVGFAHSGCVLLTVHLFVCVCTPGCLCLVVPVCMNACVLVCICACVHVACVFVCLCPFVFVCLCACVYVCVCACVFCLWHLERYTAIEEFYLRHKNTAFAPKAEQDAAGGEAGGAGRGAGGRGGGEEGGSHELKINKKELDLHLLHVPRAEHDAIFLILLARY
jgi:hypothetical protein